ncbi:uncharacterized protein HaLaN_00863 [Haematococcus lacustris]|uniref:ditrans,polycis-polyprenyl diphosphate synthase [(2E,6E)-farnesyldiphosphate specific] n=1 Tax=Haematococcus lacustris TaxID=44745 RepID=A0A699YAA5_HAELA|nr:uncharacterized protein HaLaN_00863 [Haematococcus lacustris]
MPEPDDGWGPVLAAARQGSLALQALHQARQYKQALALAMQQMAQAAGTGLLEEPELILVYSAGPVSLYGYAPFHARAAEFVAMGPVSGATQAGLVAALTRYCNVKQRFGR